MSARSVLGRAAVAVLAAAALAAAALAGKAWWESRLPASYSTMDYGPVETGRPGPPAHGHGAAAPLDVSSLTGPAGRPDRRFTLVASHARLRLSSGATVDGLAFNRSVPGPELRVRLHDLVEVTLVNDGIEEGTSIHWHGVDVPNAEDGVTGVTQDAVPDGGRHVYRFRADQPGTYWYHSHQDASTQVERGLYGALVVLPAPAHGLDLAVVYHDFAGVAVLGSSDGVHRRPAAPGTPVRLRLVNTDSGPRSFALTGAPFRVAAIDGTELAGGGLVQGRRIEVPAGGRYDLAFRMPPTAVRLDALATKAALVLGAGAPPAAEEPAEAFDPAGYGAARDPAPDRFDRAFTVSIGRRPGFRDGRPGMQWSINGRIAPRTPMLEVEPGDLVKLTLANHSHALHPMHLHGHHFRVLARSGEPAAGAAWWADTLDIPDGTTYEVAFRATNPGIWMLHCHNLGHAAQGLLLHVVYRGATTPYRLGSGTPNRPE